MRSTAPHLALALALAAALVAPGCNEASLDDADAAAGDPGDASQRPPLGDAAGADARSSGDPADAGLPPSPDAAVFDGHVHILIDNFCNTSASPESVTVAPGDTVQLTYHNHSVDYDADVWLSYGGGYLGLVTGGTWADRFEFCAGPSSYTAYADISIAGGGGSVCPKFRLLIHCE